MNPDRIAAATVDLTGRIDGWFDVEVDSTGDPVPAADAAVRASLDAAGVPLDRVYEIVIGIPGLIDPGAHELGLSWDLPRWRSGLRSALQRRIGRPVEFENDANAAAIAESRIGAAQGVADFVLVWLGRGIGLGAQLIYRIGTKASLLLALASTDGGLPARLEPRDGRSAAPRARDGLLQHCRVDDLSLRTRDLGTDLRRLAG